MSSTLLRTIGKSLFDTKFSFSLAVNTAHLHGQGVPKPRKRVPVWFTRRNRTIHDDFVTNENREFLSEVVRDRFGAPITVDGITKYPLGAYDDSILVKVKDVEPKEWTITTRRTGLIARKIGTVPLWKKDGKKIMTTMLHVEDNHVIKYIPPGEFNPTHVPKHRRLDRLGCLMVGAVGTDPAMFTKAYCGLFADTGVAPKKYLGRFIISPDAALPPGTPLNVSHFRAGDYVDVRGKTIDRGFQGVMKRWGFKGMPRTHGVTKTHRRPGNVGSGGEKARIWPGQKMPGHMGNRYRINRGLKIWRINYKHNVMWVNGLAIPGETNSIVYVFDTALPLKRKLLSPAMPTFLGEIDESVTDVWSDDCHNFKDPTIFYEPE